MFGNLVLIVALATGLTALVADVLWACGNTAIRTIARALTGAMALSVIATSAFQKPTTPRPVPSFQPGAAQMVQTNSEAQA